MKVEKADLSSYKGVLVFIEQKNSVIMPVSIELLGKGRKLADELNTHLSAIVCGSDIKMLTKDLIAYGADRVYLADDEELKTYRLDAYAKVICEAIYEYKPEIFLIGATHVGIELAPVLAVKCDTGIVTNCTSLEIDTKNRQILQTKPGFGSNLMVTSVCSNRRPQMITIAQGVMKKAVYNNQRKGEIINIEVFFNEVDIRTKIVEIVKSKGQKVKLTDAEIIVCGGRGVGSKEGFELIKQLSDKLGGAVGASRGAVNSGFIEHSYQIGQTGISVKPKLFIACGISGAIQHVAGMQKSDCIVAINTNENAPIFEIANYGIVGDLHKVIPKLLEELSL